MQPVPHPVLVVAGPTASGKSGLALAAAEEFGGTVINADSMQVYRELRVLTARPSDADEARVPHRLYGILAAAERCSAGRWATLAADAIAEAHGQGRLPIVVGGTGFYVKALISGLSAIPEVAADMRAEAMALYARLGAEAFQAELSRVDPVSAARLRVSDTQRLTRAYEVWLATGRALSDWQGEPAIPPVPGAAFFTIVLDPPRAALNAACDARFEVMLAAGALDEVRALVTQVRDLGLDPGLPALKALGVADLMRHLAGEQSLAAATAAAKLATRRFAKRQSTWFRTQIDPNERLFEQFSESLNAKIFPKIRDFILTTQI
jgi:tRNA dimethylallyltransferase